VGPAEIATTIGAVVLIGGLIGSVGIGGVLLVPWLTVIVGFGVREAVAIAMASYVATGVVAILQARFTDDWNRLWTFWPLMLATLPGAFLGGLAVAVIPESVTLLVLAVFLMLTGGWTLKKDALTSPRTGPGAGPGWITGVVSGFASALTGTGGPALLIPILLWRRVPLLAAVALGQIAQLPIALAATGGNLASGPVDLWTAALVGAALAPGVLIGRWAATRLPVGFLSRVVAVLLVATGVLLALRAIL
jgi:uncharacterized membrane protein YfcA